MKLGIHLNTDKYRDAAVGLANAAVKRGDEVTFFIMDAGLHLLNDAAFSGLSKNEKISMSFCEHSAKSMNFDESNIPAEIKASSQLNNAIMFNESDKVIVL
ncbi:MAG: DsrE family protein [Nitrospinota bacterium]|nr:DsrE family protein [Nitrospinota bacterium]